MVNGLLYKLFHPRAVSGVTVQLGATAGEYRFDWVGLEQRKGKATIKGTGHVIADIVSLKNALPENTPLVLSITGKGVLVRKVSQAKAEHPDTLIQELLPGAKARDYYFETIPASLGQVMVAVVRRSAVDALLNELQQYGLTVLHISIGPLAVAGIASLVRFDTGDRQLQLSGYSIKFNDDHVPEHVERSDNNLEGNYVVAGENLTATQVLPFATALNFWLLPTEDLFANDATGNLYGEHLHKTFFQLGVKVALGVFFVSLLLNFVLFNQQYKLNAELWQLSGNKQDRLQQFEQLKKEYDQNLAFLGGEGWLNPAKASFYADGLAATVPQEVVLTQMVVYPDTVAHKGNSDRSRFNTKSILLAGKVNSSSLLQEWAVGLRTTPWVNTVTVKNYSQENPSAQGEFDIVIEIKP